MPLRLKSRAPESPKSKAVEQSCVVLARALWDAPAGSRNELYAAMRELIGIELKLLALKAHYQKPVAVPKARTH